MKEKRNFWIWLILAFLLGVVVCHVYYYSSSSMSNKKIIDKIEQMRKENKKTQRELDRVDSLLDLYPKSSADPSIHE